MHARGINDTDPERIIKSTEARGDDWDPDQAT
jgi:hypothetical protein